MLTSMLTEFRDFLMRGNLVELASLSDEERRHQELLAAIRESGRA